MDILSPSQRSYNMSRIKSGNTKPEMLVRRWLWARGVRYRLHRKDLPGKPDIVLPRYGGIIFVHGCYWHRHGCSATTTPSTRRKFWLTKFQANQIRDRRNQQDLLVLGWRVLIIWECALRCENALEEVGGRVVDFITGGNVFSEIEAPSLSAESP